MEEGDLTQPLLGPFGDEAVAALIGAFISVVVALLLWHLNRSRTKHIVCIQAPNNVFLPVGQIGSAHSKIVHEDRELSDPWLAYLWLENTGAEVIEQPRIRFHSMKSRLIELSLEASPQRLETKVEIEKVNEHTWDVQLDYINPYDAHTERIYIMLLCSGESGTILVTGSGPGWSVRTLMQDWRRRTAARYFLAGAIIGFLSITFTLISFVLAWFTDSNSKQAMTVLWSNMWIRSSVLTLIVSIGMAFVLGVVAGRKIKWSPYGFIRRSLYWLVRDAKRETKNSGSDGFCGRQGDRFF